jgi:hypothetical protein
MQDQDDGTIAYSVRDRIAHIEIDRPGRHNALTRAQTLRLAEALDRLDADAEADVAILSGRGKSFCSGADIAESQTASRADMGCQPRPDEHRAPVFRAVQPVAEPQARDRPRCTAMCSASGSALRSTATLIVCDAGGAAAGHRDVARGSAAIAISR